MSTDTQISRSSSRINDLQSLLEKQISLARQGKLNEVGLLSDQADSLIGKIVQSGILKTAEYKSQYEELRKLYQELCLALTAQQVETAKELRRVHKGKKTIGTYRSNF